MMSLLCTAQTVWNKGLKKHWFPILPVINYGYGCILTRWTCLWLGTCNIIIRWQIIDFCRSGNNPRRVCLFVVNTYLRGRYLHVFEGVAYFIFKYFSLKIAFVFVSNRQKKLSNETTTYFSINTQVCYGHVLSLELSIKLSLIKNITAGLSWSFINIWSYGVSKY